MQAPLELSAAATAGTGRPTAGAPGRSAGARIQRKPEHRREQNSRKLRHARPSILHSFAPALRYSVSRRFLGFCLLAGAASTRHPILDTDAAGPLGLPADDVPPGPTAAPRAVNFDRLRHHPLLRPAVLGRSGPRPSTRTARCCTCATRSRPPARAASAALAALRPAAAGVNSTSSRCSTCCYPCWTCWPWSCWSGCSRARPLRDEVPALTATPVRSFSSTSPTTTWPWISSPSRSGTTAATRWSTRAFATRASAWTCG